MSIYIEDSTNSDSKQGKVYSVAADKLSFDVLVDTFIELSKLERCRDDEGDDWRNKDLTLAVSHVCKKWRTVALDIPFLWNYIAVPEYSVGQIKEYMSRSREIPLSLFINYKKCEPKKLSEKFFRVTNPIYEMENVEDLVLHSTEFDFDYTLFPRSLSHCYPKLRSLRMVMASVDPTYLSFACLRRLSIESQSMHVAAFKHILNNCPKELEELEIIDCSIRLHRGESFDDFASQTPFPNLRKLLLDTDTSSLSSVTRYLGLPSEFSWDVTSGIDVVLRGDPTILTELPAPLKGKAFTIKIHTDCLSLTYNPGITEEYGNQQSAKICCSEYNDCGLGANAFLRDAGSALPSDVIELNIGLEDIEKHPIESGVLLSLLTHTSRLRTLRISLDYPDAHLTSTIQADLLQALAMPEDNQEQQTSLPDLQNLEITNFDFAGDETGKVFSELMSCFRTRRESGLTVHVCGLHNVSDEAIDELRGIFGHDSYVVPMSNGVGKKNKKEEREKAIREVNERSLNFSRNFLSTHPNPATDDPLSAATRQLAISTLDRLGEPLP